MSLLNRLATIARLTSSFRRVPVAAALVAGIPAAFLGASLLVVAATNLSPAQTRATDFGRFDAFAGYGTIAICPGTYGPTDDVLAAARATGVQEAMVAVTAPDFYVSGLDATKARFDEAAWQTDPFPGRYRVLSGRLPASAGEVAVAGDAKPRVGDELRVHTSAPLKVVGVVDDLYSRQPVLLAGPGTWGTLSTSLAERYESMRAEPTILWRGGDDARVQAALGGSLAAAARTRAVPGEPCSSVDESSVQQSFAAAPAKDSTRAVPWAEKLPLAYTIPLGVLPLVTALMTLVASDRRRRRLQVVGDALGLPRPVLGVPHAVTTLVWGLGAVVFGFFTGLGLVHLAEPLAASAAGRPVDLDVGLAPTLLRYVALFAVGGAVGTVALIRGPARPSVPPSAASAGAAARKVRLPVAEARRLVALGLVCWAAVLATSVSSPGELMTVATAAMAGIVLLVPDLLDALLRRRQERSWDRIIACERLRASRGSTIASVCAVALATGITVGYLVLLQTWLHSADGDRPPAVAPGEVLVADRSSALLDPPAAAVETVEKVLPKGARKIRLVRSLEVGKDGAALGSLTLDDDAKPFFVAADLQDARAMVGHRLTDVETATLTRGGALVWQGSSAAGTVGDHAVAKIVIAGDDYRGPRSLIARTTGVPASAWRFSASGVVLRSTFAGGPFPAQTGAVVFGGVSPDVAAQIRQAVESAGIDPDTVMTYRASARLVPALALPGLAVALAFLTALLGAAATWSTARESRALASALVAVGVPPARGRRIIVWQCLLLDTVALVVGLGLAAIPVLGIRLLLPGYTLAVPWADLVTLSVAIVVGMTGSALLATTRVRASARTADM